MADNVQRSRGRPQGYKFDRGGQAAEMGPFIGIVVNNVDNTRSGRLQVYIEEFGATKPNGAPNLADKSLWRTVSYAPPFYGATPQNNAGSAGTGAYPGNRNSYGMWFTPPDIGTQVLCFFVAGDPTQGYYTGCIPEPGINHMIPAIGAAKNYVPQNGNQETYFAGSPQLPVSEINTKNTQINENPKFFDQPKPVHSYQAAVLFQQGLEKDTIRGSIGSSSQRESPSACYGISTPGRPIFQGGATDSTIEQKVASGGLKLSDVQVIGRRGGHTIVMDDGDLAGKDNLVRIRTAKGHQITMSDDGNCFYITHANGQTWIELGQEGTVDVFSTNSVNVRTKGTINLHADEDINMYAGKRINMKSAKGMSLQSDEALDLSSKQDVTVFSSTQVGIKSNGALALKSKNSSWDGGGSLSLKASQINLQGGATIPVATPAGITKTLMPDATFNSSTGWTVNPTGIESIVTRAPSHEPYPYHNQGVPVDVKLEPGQTTPPPAAPPVPEGTKITKTAGPVPGATTAATANAAPANAATAAATRPTLAEQQAAQQEMENAQNEYERLKAEFGILDPRAEAAFATYKAALARFQKLVGTNY